MSKVNPQIIALKGEILHILGNDQTPAMTNRQLAEALGLGKSGRELWQVSGAIDVLLKDGLVKTALEHKKHPSNTNSSDEYAYRVYLTSDETALEQRGIISAERSVSSKDALELFDSERLHEVVRSGFYKPPIKTSTSALLAAFRGNSNTPKK